MFMAFALGLVAGLAGAFAWRGWFRVEEGHEAVLLRFGRAQRNGEKLRVFGPGLHPKLPFEEVLVVAAMERSLELSGEHRGRTAMTNDGTVLRFDSVLRYVLEPGGLERFLFGLREPLEHVTGLFTCLLRNEIANFGGASEVAAGLSMPPRTVDAGSYALIRRERRRLNRQIDEFVRQRMGDRYGLRFVAVDLVDILPPDELDEALNAVLQAQSVAERDYFRAEAEASRRTLSSERSVAIARSRAEAEAKEITVLAATLAELERSRTLDAYVARRRAEVLSEARLSFVKEPTS
jgi:regulator of protease activity HflC (stomatin/prohibitin superfamily)